MQMFSLVAISFLAVLGLFYLAQLALELLLKKELRRVVTVVRADSDAYALYAAVNALGLLPPTRSLVVCGETQRGTAEALCATRADCFAVTREELAENLGVLLFEERPCS